MLSVLFLDSADESRTSMKHVQYRRTNSSLFDVVRDLLIMNIGKYLPRIPTPSLGQNKGRPTINNSTMCGKPT